MSDDTTTTELRPFRVEVPDAVLDDLRDRLRRTRWPDQIPGSGWGYGTDTAYLRDLCDHWATVFDWRAQEERFNRWPHFLTEIDGQTVHFIHARSPEPDALPLVITHGWPGSVAEFLDVIDPLRDPKAHGAPDAPAFHVVCPSIPGYGWSGPTRDAGWDVRRVAETWKQLMARLGYERYGAQGGDWGSMISSQLGSVDPEHVVGVHLNMVVAFPPADGGELSEQEQRDLEDLNTFLNEGTAYQQVHGKNPQTLGVALNDSPAGLASWIVEKFHAWTHHPDGDVEDAVSRDQILTNLTVYWVTQTINSSIRLYCESQRSGRFPPFDPVTVPVGAAIFPAEIIRAPRAWAEGMYRIVHWNRYDRGGHFAALEEPDLLVADVREFFASLAR